MSLSAALLKPLSWSLIPLLSIRVMVLYIIIFVLTAHSSVQILIMLIVVMLAVSVIAWRIRCISRAAIFSLCLCTIFACASLALESPLLLEKNNINRVIQSQGMVASLITRKPRVDGNESISFDIRLLKDDSGLAGGSYRDRLIRLYADGDEFSQLQPGDIINAQIKLRPPHGAVNPSGFDYGRWLISRGYFASGSVVAGSGQRIEAGQAGSELHAPQITLRLMRLRSEAIDYFKTLALGEYSPHYIALVFGDKRGLTQAHKTQLRELGLQHLFVVSGLHIGIIFAVALALLNALARVLSIGQIRLFASAPLLFALIIAWFYAGLAGLGTPCLRATIMLTVLVLARCSGIILPWWQSTIIAAFIVLILRPLEVFNPGFYFSFVAVAVILVTLCARFKSLNVWQALPALQMSLFVVMSSLSGMLAGGLSLGALLNNLLAVPLFSLLLVPLVLLSSVFSLINSKLAHSGWLLADCLVEVLNTSLSKANDLLGLHYVWLHKLNIGLVLIAIVILLLSLWPVVQRRLCLLAFGLLILIYPRPEPYQTQEYDVEILDVGQGLAVLVRTQNYVVLYDVGGTRYGGYSVTDNTVLPYLRRSGVKSLDLLVLSHNDADHAGDAQLIIDELRPKTIIRGQAEQEHDGFSSERCTSQRWQHNNIEFEFFDANSHPRSANDQSCVLKIRSAYGSILLPGDVSAERELELLAIHGDRLRADVLVAAHHGSISSSSWPWLKQLSPQHIIYSAGLYHRFSHPHRQIQRRAKALAIDEASTGLSGLINVRFRAANLSLLRERIGRYSPWYYRINENVSRAAIVAYTGRFGI